MMEKQVVWIVLLAASTFGLQSNSEFGPPSITLNCMEDYMTLQKYINVTWKPNPLVYLTTEELEHRIQNCEAAITCSNNHMNLGDCPFNTKVEIYDGWEFKVPINETFCTIRVTYIDRDNSHVSHLTTTRGNCTFSAPTPNIMVVNSSEYVNVGHSKEIHCIANTSERVNPIAVNITWIGPNGPITNNSRLFITPTVSNGTNHISTLQFSYLSEDDEGLYECNVTVLEMSKMEFHSLINFNIPTPSVTVTALNNQQVGDLLSLECNVTTVRGITSSVDIVWITNDEEVRRVNNVSGETRSKSKVYKDYYDIPLSLLKNNSIYYCQVIINTKQLVSTKEFHRIDLEPPQTGRNPTSSSVNSLTKAIAGLMISIVISFMLLFAGIICCGIFGRRKLLQCCMADYKTEIVPQMSPSIMNIDYSAIGREEASRCENLYEKDFVWTDSLQMPTVNEELFTSISSSCLTNEEMLHYLHGHGPTVELIDSRTEDDSGINMSSVIASDHTSFMSSTTDGNIHCVINISESSEEEYCNDDADEHRIGDVTDSDDQISQIITEHCQSTIATHDDACLAPGPPPIDTNVMNTKDTSVNSSINDVSVATCPIPYKNNEAAIMVNAANCPIITDKDTTDTQTLTSLSLANSSNVPSSQQKFPSHSTEIDERVVRVIVSTTWEGISFPNESHKITTLKEGDYVDHNYDVTAQEEFTPNSSL